MSKLLAFALIFNQLVIVICPLFTPSLAQYIRLTNRAVFIVCTGCLCFGHNSTPQKRLDQSDWKTYRRRRRIGDAQVIEPNEDNKNIFVHTLALLFHFLLHHFLSHTFTQTISMNHSFRHNTNMWIYIYIYIEREIDIEKERDSELYIYNYIYI